MADEITAPTEGVTADVPVIADPAAVVAEPVVTEPVVAEEVAPVVATSELTSPAPHPTDAIASDVTDEGAIVYAETGNVALDVALGFFGNLGLASSDPAISAAAKGNFAILEAKLAALGDKAQGWQQMVALAKGAYTDSVAKYTESVAATDKAILSVVQSAENWNAIKAWAAKNSDPAEKAAINKMIDGGPVQARAAATLLLQAYKAASGTVITPANPARDASGQPADVTGPLTQREYATAVNALHRKLGTRMESSPEYRALKQRLAR